MGQRLKSNDDAARWDPLSGLEGKVVRRYLVLDMGTEDADVTLPSGARGRLLASYHSPDLAFALAEAERGQGHRALVYDLRQLRMQAARARMESTKPAPGSASDRAGQPPASAVARREHEAPRPARSHSTARPCRRRGPERS